MGKYLVNLAKSMMSEFKIPASHELDGYLPRIRQRMRRMSAETLGKIAAAQSPAKLDLTMGSIAIKGDARPGTFTLLTIDKQLTTPREFLVLLASMQIYATMHELRKNLPIYRREIPI
jgi:hypothetical protein